MNIYIGNFAYNVTEDDIKAAFEAFGYVDKIKVIKDKFSGESKGFGFVEMPNKTEAQAAIQGITEIKGKKVTINEARPQTRQQGFGRGKRSGPHDNNFGRRERRY